MTQQKLFDKIFRDSRLWGKENTLDLRGTSGEDERDERKFTYFFKINIYFDS